MDLIFIIGIGLLFTLLVVIVGIYGYLRIFPWRQTVLSFRSNSYCEPDIHFAKIRELEEQLEIERKAKKFYNTLYIVCHCQFGCRCFASIGVHPAKNKSFIIGLDWNYLFDFYFAELYYQTGRKKEAGDK